MALLSRMGFVDAQGLSVAYRATAEPQVLTVDVATAAPPREPMAHWCMRALADTIRLGGAGGDALAPTLGLAERLSGPWDGPDAMGTAHRWELRVAGVAPLFMRNMVEELRRAGGEHDVIAMRIVGSAPLDDTPWSVREEQVRAWTSDGSTYLGAFRDLGFPLEATRTGLGAYLRLELDAVPDPVRLALEELSVAWLNAVRNHASEDGTHEVFPSPATMLPYFGTSRSEFRAHFRVFTYRRDASRALLVNMLARFHAEVAPILSAVIEL